MRHSLVVGRSPLQSVTQICCANLGTMTTSSGMLLHPTVGFFPTIPEEHDNDDMEAARMGGRPVVVKLALADDKGACVRGKSGLAFLRLFTD